MVFYVVAAILLFFAIIGYAVFGMLKKAGMLVSPQTANASSLYQVYPFEQDGKHYFLSVEGVFKTSTYEQSGGTISRSGSTSYRLGLYDLATGQRANRLVISDDVHEKIKVIGKAGNKLWCYSNEEGLHSRTIPGLAVDIKTEKILNANKALGAGLAKADKYFTNVDELFSADDHSNKLMVTTIDGKSIWINATSFTTTEQPPYGVDKNHFVELVQKMIDASKNGRPVDTAAITSRLRTFASDLDHSLYNQQTSSYIKYLNGCYYQFEGQTISNLVKSNCPDDKQPDDTAMQAAPAKKQFISARFLVNEITIASQSPRLPANGVSIPTPAGDNAIYIFHKDKIDPTAHFVISKYDLKSERTIWQHDVSVHFAKEPTIKSTYVLNNLLLVLFKLRPALDDNFSCIAIDRTTGKQTWQITF
jgi:hypothetical protein